MTSPRTNGKTAGAVDGVAALGQEAKTPEEYVEQRRLRDIFDARQELRETRVLVDDARHEGKLRIAANAYRAALANYVTEVEPLLRQYERGVELLFDHHYGSVRIEPIVEHTETPCGPDKTLVKGTDREVRADHRPSFEHTELEIDGLEQLFELDSPIRRRFTVETPTGARESVVVKTQLGFQTMDRMTRAVNVFLSEIGLELEPDPGEEEADVDYSELL